MWKFRVMVAGVALAMAGSPAAGAAGGDVLSFNFDGGSAARGEPVTSVRSQGLANVTARVISRDGGRAVRVRGHHGYGLRLPRYSTAAHPPAAVLRVTNATSNDRLSPGRSAFTFGATARLFSPSQGSTSDNGNNLMQRGLYHQSAQYKLDLDHRRPGCSVAGHLGRVSVRMERAVNSRDWYRLTCRRSGSKVTLAVRRYRSGGLSARWVKSASGPIGAVTMANARIPVSIGGKLSAAGALTKGEDQFNGIVDDVVLRF